MKRRFFCLSLLLFFLDCRSTKLLRLFSGSLQAMFVVRIFIKNKAEGSIEKVYCTTSKHGNVKRTFEVHLQ